METNINELLGAQKKRKTDMPVGNSDGESSSSASEKSSSFQKLESFNIQPKQNLSKIEKINMSNLVNSNAIVQTTQAYEIAIRTKNMNNQSRSFMIGAYPVTIRDFINFVDTTPDTDILQLISENITAKKGGMNIKPFTKNDLKNGNAILREKFYNFKVGSLISIVPKSVIEITDKKMVINVDGKKIDVIMGNVTEDVQFGATTIYKFIDRNKTVVEEQQNIAARNVPPLDLYTKHNSPVKIMCSTGNAINSGALIANIKAIFDTNKWDSDYTLNPKNATVVLRALRDKLRYFDTIERDFMAVFGVASILPPYTLLIPNDKWTISSLPSHVLFASYNSRMKDQIRPRDPLSADLQNYIPWRHVPKDLIVALVRYYIEAVRKCKFQNFIAESEKNVMMQFREKQHIYYLENYDRLLYFNAGDIDGLDLSQPSFVPLPNLSVFSKPIGERTLETNETKKERNINFSKFVKKLAVGSAIVMPYVFPEQGTTFNNQLLSFIAQHFDLLPYPIGYENNVILIKRLPDAKLTEKFYGILNHYIYAYAHVNNLRNIAYYAEICGEVLSPYFRSNPLIKEFTSSVFNLEISGIDIKVEKVLGIVGNQIAYAKVEDFDAKMEIDGTTAKSNDTFDVEIEEENVPNSPLDSDHEEIEDNSMQETSGRDLVEKTGEN
jgi:hypothetical protein